MHLSNKLQIIVKDKTKQSVHTTLHSHITNCPQLAVSYSVTPPPTCWISVMLSPFSSIRPAQHIEPPQVNHLHKHRNLVNFGWQDIVARKYMYEKLTKCPNFTLPKKLKKSGTRILHDICPKNTFSQISGANSPPWPHLSCL